MTIVKRMKYILMKTKPKQNSEIYKIMVTKMKSNHLLFKKPTM